MHEGLGGVEGHAFDGSSHILRIRFRLFVFALDNFDELLEDVADDFLFWVGYRGQEGAEGDVETALEEFFKDGVRPEI